MYSLALMGFVEMMVKSDEAVVMDGYDGRFAVSRTLWYIYL